VPDQVLVLDQELGEVLQVLVLVEVLALVQAVLRAVVLALALEELEVLVLVLS